MKYHVTKDGKTAVCKSVTNRPDTFLYPPERFQTHYAKEFECKKCAKALKN